MRAPDVQLQIPPVYSFLFSPARYKCVWGGRGSGKSWACARALIAIAYTRKVRILCVREFQSSIADSVLRLLADQIEALGLLPWFDVQKTTIVCRLTGSEFLFKGLRHNVQEIKSTEGVDYCWSEESQSVTAESWQVLIPTIRKDNSEIWVSFNAYEETDSTYVRFVLNPNPSAVVKKTSWSDNPAFPKELDAERRYLLQSDPDAYSWIWDGHCRTISDAIIFKGKFRIEPFETPETARFFHGIDWGFATDPSVMVRCFIENETLFVDAEAYAHGIEIDALPELFDTIPTSRSWPIFADSSRPETVSFIRRLGFAVSGAPKWPGSIEDGVAHLKSFGQIVVHEKCIHTAQEMRLYSYKKDVRTGDVLPIILDKNNHCCDSLRYALSGYIQKRGSGSIFARLVD